MRRCPVCEEENNTLLCLHCGFDGSCDYESYPTLGTVPWQSRSRAGYHKALEKQETDSPSGISSAGRDAIENIKKKQEELAKKRQEELAKKQQEEQAKKEKEEQFKKLEKLLLWLGWASLVAIPCMLIFEVSPVSKLFYFLMALEPVTLLVQLHLRRHGLTRIFRNEKVSKVFRDVCGLIWVTLGILIVIIFAGFISSFFEILFDGARLSRFKWWNIFSITIPTTYYFLWALFHSAKG